MLINEPNCWDYMRISCVDQWCFLLMDISRILQRAFEAFRELFWVIWWFLWFDFLKLFHLFYEKVSISFFLGINVSFQIGLKKLIGTASFSLSLITIVSLYFSDKLSDQWTSSVFPEKHSRVRKLLFLKKRFQRLEKSIKSLF